MSKKIMRYSSEGVGVFADACLQNNATKAEYEAKGIKQDTDIRREAHDKIKMLLKNKFNKNQILNILLNEFPSFNHPELFPIWVDYWFEKQNNNKDNNLNNDIEEIDR